MGAHIEKLTLKTLFICQNFKYLMILESEIVIPLKFMLARGLELDYDSLIQASIFKSITNESLHPFPLPVGSHPFPKNAHP